MAISGEMIFKPKFSKLSKKVQIVIFLTALKAKKLLSFTNEEHATSRNISDTTGVGLKTTREILSRLKKERMINSQSRGSWYISDKNLMLLHEHLSRYSKNEETK